MKYYAVRHGKTPGIYTSWPECQENVKGYSGAVFKGFDTMDAAQAYMAEETQTAINEDLPTAYIDGSYSKAAGRYGYGGFISANGTNYIVQGSGDNPKFIDERNIAGELLGALQIITQAARLDLPEMNLYYDYSGIANYLNGSWQAKTELAKYYKLTAELLQTCNIKVNFIKLAGHTGIYGNEIADYLAKEAVGATLRKKDIAALEDFRKHNFSN